ncbi:hypothetical protein [Desulfurobacterium sp.]
MKGRMFLVAINAALGFFIGLFTDIQLFKTLGVKEGHFILGIVGGIAAAKFLDLMVGEFPSGPSFLFFLLGLMIGVSLGMNLHYAIPTFILFVVAEKVLKRTVED